MSIQTAIRSRLQRVMPWMYSTSKHCYYDDYGWIVDPQFQNFYRVYCRNSIASAAIDKTISKTWQSKPALWEQPDKPAETALEQQIEKHFRKIGLWRSLMQVDQRSMVGAFAAAIILVRDNQMLDQPVTRVSRIEDIAGLVPVWEGQLRVADWDTNRASPNYGQPLMFEFNEQAVDPVDGKAADLPKIHPSRILIWSDDGTINGRSSLEACFNDLTDLEKIKGAGGEGFWKTARGSPIISADKELTFEDVKKQLGATTAQEAKEKLDAKLDDWQSGFDKGLMLAGMTANTLTINLPQPKEFFDVGVQSVAASFNMPFKELIGNVTGERASTEDAQNWNRACESRRENRCIPNIELLVARLVEWGALPDRDWVVGWQSLLDATPDEMLDRAVKMKSINTGGELTFLPNEIREVAGFASTDEVEGWDEYQQERDERESEERAAESAAAGGF